eukprot:2723635-Pyramimonas_sp.AAC.1
MSPMPARACTRLGEGRQVAHSEFQKIPHQVPCDPTLPRPHPRSLGSAVDDTSERLFQYRR